MKTESKIIAFTVVAALGLWVADAMLDSLVFYHIPFRQSLFAQVNREELLERTVGVLAIIILGINFAQLSQQRSRLQAAREESERLATTLIAEGPLPYQSLDAAGCILSVNQLWLDTLGYSRDEVIGRSFGEFMTPYYARIFPERFPQFSVEGQVTALEVDLVKKDGTIITTSYNGRVVYDEQGQFVRTHYLFVDITERKRAELTIAEERRRLNDIIKGTNVGTWEYDQNTGESVISDRWAEILGYTRQELSPVTMEKWNELTHPDDLQASNKALREHFAGERDYYECELRMRHKQGGWVWVLDRGRVHTWSDDGKPRLMSGTHQDITERKQAEETFRIRESCLTAIIENQPGLMWLKDVDSRFLSVNQEFAKSCGREKPENVVGLTDIDVWPRDLADKYRSDDANVMKSGKSVTLEEPVLDGSETKWFETLKTPVFDSKGVVIGTTGYAHDITERREAREALRASEERYRIVTEQTGQIVYDWIVKSGNIHWAGAIERVTGYDPESYQKVDIQGWEQMIHPEDRQRAVEALEAAERSETPYLSEYRLLRKDGSYVFVEDNGIFLKDIFGETVRMLGTMKDITERVQARAQLEERENFLRGIFDGIQDGISVLSTDLTILRVNKQMQAVHADSLPLEGKKCYEVYAQAKSPCASCRVLRSIQTKTLQTEQIQCRTPGRESRWLELHAYPMTNSTGQCYAVIEYVRDITERRTAEEELARSEIKYRTLFESAQDAIFLMKDYIFVDCNSTTCEMFGCRREQILQQSPVRFSPAMQPDGTESTQKALEKMNEAMAGRPQLFEWTHIRLDGTCFDAEVKLNGIQIAGEQYILAIVRDITERKQAQKALETSLSMQRATLESTADGILVVDRVGKVSSFNRKFLEMWRIPEFLTVLKDDEKLIKYVVDQLKDPQRFIERVQQLYANPKSQSYDIVEFKDGRVFERHSQPQMVGDEVAGRVWSFRDLTERKRVEKELARLATATEQAAEAIVITDLEGRIEYVNPAFENVSGYRRDETIGTNMRSMSASEQDDRLQDDLWRALREGEIWTGRLRSRRKDGSVYEEECSISPIRDQSGVIVSYVAVKRDVTQEVEFENRLRQSQKLEAVGLLAAGIAHDFNNLLAGIKGFAELLTLDEEVGLKAGGYAEEILKAANRAADLTGQLLAFARKGRLLSVAVNVNEVIDEVKAILKHSIDRRIAIKTERRAEQPFTNGDPSQIQSAILNLAINARDAMPDGGVLTFETENVHLDEAYCRLHSLDLGAGEYLSISVTDTGIGMDEEVMSHIFEPFFTTKEQGQGTGLGLPGVYGCLKNHHGSIEVTSRPGNGSKFRLLFPSSAAEHDQALPSQRRRKLTGEERLLVVEDEEIVRKLTIKILTNAGYHVTTCADGWEAVTLYKDNAAKFDLVLLDMMMPRMDGKDAFAAMKLVNPHICALLMTGRADNDAQELLDLGIKGFILKPFLSKQLLQKIREALDAAKSQAARQSQLQ